MAKILLVEDDNNLREIYEARLQAEGFSIVSAHDGEEALVVAKNERPDLIISDVMMPKISGFEMLDIIRATPTLANVKIIMLTALGQNEDQDRANKLGADRYLVKSQVTLEDIVNATNELLSQPTAPALDQLNNDTLTAQSDQASPEPIMPQSAPEMSASVPTQPETFDSPVSTDVPASPMVEQQSAPIVTTTDKTSVQLPEMENQSNEDLINQAVEAINKESGDQSGSQGLMNNLPPSMNIPTGGQRNINPISSQTPKLDPNALNTETHDNFDPNNIAL